MHNEVWCMAKPRTLNCSKCGALKDRFRNGYSRCIPCHNRHGREYYHRSAVRRANQRRSYITRRYGTSLDEVHRLLGVQGERCAICGRNWRDCPPAKRIRNETTFLQHLCIDHDHRSGAIRGLLCNACNTAIGLFEEDAQRLLGAVAYLKAHTVSSTA